MANANGRLNVHLTPRASRDQIEDWRDGVLRVRVSAPPVDGRANEALIRVIAAALKIAPSRIRVVAVRVLMTTGTPNSRAVAHACWPKDPKSSTIAARWGKKGVQRGPALSATSISPGCMSGSTVLIETIRALPLALPGLPP